MAELNPIYNSTLTCPVCEKKIEVSKVRSRFVKLISQDEDFCPYYEMFNPLLYEAWVCKYCGYAAHSSVFTEVSFNDRKMVLDNIKPKWTSRDFTGERDINKALEAFKIVLYNLQVRGAQLSEFGKICLRIAWMYRYKGECVDEYKYLKYSYDYYKKSFSQEYLSKGKLDEYTLMYILGELARRLELYDEALQWFGKLVSASVNQKEKSKIQPRLIEMIKDQIHITREKAKKNENENKAINE